MWQPTAVSVTASPSTRSCSRSCARAVPDQGAGRKLAPREIQAHIRAGMSAQDVASITGVPLEYIQRFEGPVLAEREYVVETALGVPVHTAADTNPFGTGMTFGTAIRSRLHDLGAINERWASWKEMASGWVVKLSFTANQIDHDARWSFDPKKLSLVPLNNEAVQLSQQGDASGALMPRLRAVATTEHQRDESRFDSGAFAVDEPRVRGRGDHAHRRAGARACAVRPHGGRRRGAAGRTARPRTCSRRCAAAAANARRRPTTTTTRSSSPAGPTQMRARGPPRVR